MSGPVITVDLEKVEENSRVIVNFCREHGIAVMGVTKVTCGMPSVARAMISGGIRQLGESRIENIKRLRNSGIDVPITLLRIPPLSAAREVVMYTDCSLNSELPVMSELSAAAEELGKIHDVILMLDLGDLREGIWPDDLMTAARKVLELPGIHLRGLGTNLTCYGGVLPTQENMKTLALFANRIEEELNISLEIVSGGNSSSLDLVSRGQMPKRINQLRIGEAIMLGRETAFGKRWPGTSPDAFILKAELIEVKEKPSVPKGKTGMDAFGKKPVFTDRGLRKRGILNIGREDVAIEGLAPVIQGVSILGASSDHLLVDITDSKKELKLGSEVGFVMDYGALLAGMTSSYVIKEPILRGVVKQQKRIVLTGDSPVFSPSFFPEDMRMLGYSVEGPLPATEDTLIETMKQGAIPFVAGRDRLTLLGMKAMGSALGQSGFILIDSHPSLMSDPDAPEDRKVLSSALGLFDPSINVSTEFSPENIVLIGIREADREESEIIRRMNITAFTMEDIDFLGIREVMHRSLRTAGAGTAGVYLSFCQNVIDGNGEGLTTRELHLAMELISRSGLMRCMDISGCLKRGQKDFSSLLHFTESVFGKRILIKD